MTENISLTIKQLTLLQSIYMKKLQKYLVDTLTLSSDTKMTLGKKG